MKRIAFLIPYFGQFNNYFALWLKSCECNIEIVDFFIFTDIDCRYKLPYNVKLINTTFNELKKKIQSLYDFNIMLNTPYKLCDYKPAYGEIFRDYINDYSHWAFGDNDLIWGNWKNILPENWYKYDRLGKFGHLSIIKNNPQFRSLYRYADAYKLAFTKKGNYFFDERAFNNIFQKKHINIYDLKIANCNSRKLKLSLTGNYARHSSGLFIWEEGKLYQIYSHKKKICKDEFMYIHFLKRRMTVRGVVTNINKITIYYKTLDLTYSRSIVKEDVDRLSQNKFYTGYWLKFINPYRTAKSLYYKIFNKKSGMKKMDQIINEYEEYDFNCNSPIQ